MKDHNRSKQINTVMKFNENHPNEYCWSDLYDMATETDREWRNIHKEQAKSTRICMIDMNNNGSCWCGKFKKQ